MKKSLLVALVMMLGFLGTAKAGIMVEPYLGYEIGKLTSSDAVTNGTAFGARLAYKAPLFFWAGIDASLGTSGKYKPTFGSEADMKHNTYYGVVGVEFPILLRAWVGSGFSDQFVIDSGYNSTMKGTNFKAGIGLTMLPFISINVEYLKGTVTEISGGSLANSSPTTTNESYMVSASLPLFF